MERRNEEKKTGGGGGAGGLRIEPKACLSVCVCVKEGVAMVRPRWW